MHKTSRKVFEHIIATRPTCERNALLHDHICQGRSTNEHPLYWANKQIPDEFAVVRLCAWAHGVDQFLLSGGGFVKEIGEWIALNRATSEDFKKYPRTNWLVRLNYLNKKYSLKT